MYTQCSKCETVFKLSAEVLRAAGGQVRCGRCGEVFNALARLAEDSSGFASGESPLELEARADSILESVVTPQIARVVAKDYEDFGPPGVEIAQLEVLDWSEPDHTDRRRTETPQTPEVAPEEPAEHLLEFTLPPGDLDRIFVESKQRVPTRPPPAPPEAPVEPEPDPEPNRVTGLEVPENVRREMLAGIDSEIDSGIEQEIPPAILLSPPRSKPSRQFMIWFGAAILATLLLIIQIAHQGPFGGVVRMLYGAFGAPLPPPANLSAYQLRQWGVTGDPDANGKLRLRASILNTAAQLQPYPLLRVTLADRFGKGIGTRDFEPSEYLGKPTARLLTPGERADATLEILDPGKNAEGFEIDVCLRGADQRVSCANDAAPQPKR